MKKVRQDAWSTEDDSLLAEIILRHVRTGSTQLAAFQEASRSLGRTAAATGYRWNAIVRKQFAAQIEIAKAQWKEEKGQSKAESPATEAVEGVTPVLVEAGTTTVLEWPDVLKFLKGQKGEFGKLQARLSKLEREHIVAEVENARLKEENHLLGAELHKALQELTLVKEDYAALVGIMERARKMVLVSEDVIEEHQPTFVMEQNGNLERIK